MFTAIYLVMLYGMSTDTHFILVLSAINAAIGLFDFYNDKDIAE